MSKSTTDTAADSGPSEDAGLNLLIKRHPRLFRGRPPQVWSHVPPGWLGILDRLLTDIDSLLDDAQARRFQVQQIKEKFGTLRFYWSARFSGQPGEELVQAVDRLVEAAEGDSAACCYECGEPGKLRSMGGWLSVRCDRHAKGYPEVQR